MEQQLEQIQGRIISVLFFDEDDGYTVLRMELDDGSQATVVGCIPLAASGESMTAWGSWTRHATHGEQFKAEYVERVMPTGSEAIYDYLASRVIKGIGPATAALIVSAFGDDSLNVLRDEPEKLATLRGISRSKANEISEAFRRQTNMRTLMEYLSSANIGPIYALRLYRSYGEDALDIVQDNPYILTSVQIGASFADADALALTHGMESDAPQRIAAALIFQLRHNSDNGHCFLPVDKLIASVVQLIGVDIDRAQEGLDTLIAADEVVIEPVSNVTACYLTHMYDAEVYVAERLREMAGYTYPSSRVDLSLVIEKIEQEQGIRFAPLQRQTLDVAVNKQLIVITGGPGTGKTTSVRAVLSLFDAMGLDTMLAAPTGQAAKRMTEVTGRSASTIHRLLEASFSAETDSVTFRKNEKDKLKCGALILDECSMIDIGLMRAVLAALGSDCRLVLVGDVDQLPSVGPGCVFRDIIRSGVADTIRLTQIFRQQEDSRIVTAAHEVNRGQTPDLRLNKGGFYFMSRMDAENAADTVVSLCAERLPKNMNIPNHEIQVLSPTRKGPAGTAELNRRLQAVLNPAMHGKNEITSGKRIFREGDRVVQIRNDYDILWKTDSLEAGTGVFNGDIGHIVSIDPAAESMTIDFDGRRAEYLFEQAAELEHAWAMTVHKSQGSEYRAVILALSQVPAMLQYRGVLYTAITRASELLVAVGDSSVVQRMTENARRSKRYSGLWLRLAHE